jgi:rhodanese-related sulfurtransferase
MKSAGLSRTLFAALLLAVSAQAQDLSVIVVPPPGAPALTPNARALIDAANARVPQLDTAGLLAQMKAQPDTVVLDVRTPAEVDDSGYITAPHFLNITRGLLEFRIEAAVPDKTTPIVVYCGVSQRSPLAAATLTKLGYTRVMNYRDGFVNWRRAGLPIE